MLIAILVPVEDVDFYDAQFIPLSEKLTALQAWQIVMRQSMPLMKFAFRVRDTISELFGVQKISGFSGTVPETVQVSQKHDFFLVEYISDNVLTLTARDKHLDVMTCVSVSDDMHTITSSVMTHNIFGRCYMIPNAPAHKMIEGKNLRQIQAAQVIDV